jgi:hypothetical protein
MQKDLRRNPAAHRGFLEGAQPGFLRGESSNWRPAHRETGHQSLIVATAIRKIESIAEMVLRYRNFTGSIRLRVGTESRGTGLPRRESPVDLLFSKSPPVSGILPGFKDRGNSFPVVSRSANPPANQYRPAGTKQYADPCKSTKALVHTHTHSLSRFHRPQRGKSTCARKVRNAVTDFCA